MTLASDRVLTCSTRNNPSCYLYYNNSGKLSKEKFDDSYKAWKNHISHGNCVKLGYEMDRYIEGLLK